MAKKKNNVPIILAVAGGAIAIGALVYIFGFTPAKDIFTKGKAERALSSGKMEVSANELEDYFVSLPEEEVKALLSASEGKFLFPQVDFLITEGKSLAVEKKEADISGFPISFLAVSGLSSGAKIYSTGGGFVRGGTVPNGDDSYAWMKEIREEGGTGEIMLTYFPMSPIEAISNLTFNVGMDEEMYSPVPYGSQLASLLTDNTLPESLVPGGASIAFAIAGDDGVYTKLELENILTQNGRIVMVQR